MRTAFRATLLTFSRPSPKGVCAMIITPKHSRIVDNKVLFIMQIVEIVCKGTKYLANGQYIIC
jgi:hypothetical protein